MKRFLKDNQTQAITRQMNCRAIVMRRKLSSIADCQCCVYPPSVILARGSSWPKSSTIRPKHEGSPSLQLPGVEAAIAALTEAGASSVNSMADKGPCTKTGRDRRQEWLCKCGRTNWWWTLACRQCGSGHTGRAIHTLNPQVVPNGVPTGPGQHQPPRGAASDGSVATVRTPMLRARQLQRHPGQVGTRQHRNRHLQH